MQGIEVCSHSKRQLFQASWVSSPMLTYFALLVCLQLINEVNARRINDELNVFEGIHKSPIFIGVLLVTAGLQVRLTGVSGLVCDLPVYGCGCRHLFDS
jgi:hypothetical protein